MKFVKDWITLITSVTIATCWTVLQIYAFSHSSSLTSVTHLRNSKGDVCREGENQGRENLLYFDISKCDGLDASSEKCTSEKVCSADCPSGYWTFTQGKSAELRKYCQPSLTNETWHRSSILTLVNEGLCPSHLLPSTSINGLCVPQIGLATPEKAANMSIIMERIQVSSVQTLESKKVLGGSKYAQAQRLAMRGFWEKFLLNFVTSKDFLFISIFLAIWVFFICVILTPKVHTVAAVSEFFNFCAKCLCPARYTKDWFRVLEKSTKVIEKAVRRILLVKPILLVPTIGLLLKFLVAFLTIYSSCLLTSPKGVKEFRVVGACLEELCHNTYTKRTFREGDICVPDHFKECTGCPKAKCIFHGLAHSLDAVETSREFRVVGSCEEEHYLNDETNTTYADGDECNPLLFGSQTTCPGAKCEVSRQLQTDHLLNFLLIFNFFGLLWLLRFIEVIIDNIVANFESAWQEEGGKEMSLRETAALLLSSARNVSLLQMAVKASFPCLPLPLFASSEESTSQGEEDGQMDDEKEIAEKQKNVRRVNKIIIITAGVVSSLLASTISFTILATTQGSSLAMELQNLIAARFLLFLAMVTSCIVTISCFSSTLNIFVSLAITISDECPPSRTDFDASDSVQEKFCE